MYSRYDLHSWNLEYREEALRQARERSLADQASRSPRANRFQENMLSLLRRGAPRAVAGHQQGGV
jgi:hypothetical protein